jgi:osmotically-inducible protein OsmY
MADRVLPLRLGTKTCFEDRWQGRVTGFDIAEDWEVLNITVGSGFLFFANSAKLPFSAVTKWGDDGVYLNVISFHAFNRQVPPVAAPSRPISAETPIAHPGARLAGLLIRTADRKAEAVLVARGMAGPLLRVDVANVQFDGKTLTLGQHVENLREYRSDDDLLDVVRYAIRENDVIPPDEKAALITDVDAGTVVLSGNVHVKGTAELVEGIVRGLPGVVSVRNEIANDMDIETAIGLALDRAGVRSDVYARSNLGVVTLYGYAPSAAAVDDITRTVAGVHGVRKIVSRMDLRALVPG